MEIQYRAVRENAGIFNRSKRGKVRAEGADCLRFLHGMVSNTVESLAENEGNYAAVTSARGQTLLDVWVHRLRDCIYMETEPGLATKLIETLDRYLIADDVTLSDESDAWAILGVQGPQPLNWSVELLGTYLLTSPNTIQLYANLTASQFGSQRDHTRVNRAVISALHKTVRIHCNGHSSQQEERQSGRKWGKYCGLKPAFPVTVPKSMNQSRPSKPV